MTLASSATADNKTCLRCGQFSHNSPFLVAELPFCQSCIEGSLKQLNGIDQLGRQGFASAGRNFSLFLLIEIVLVFLNGKSLSQQSPLILVFFVLTALVVTTMAWKGFKFLSEQRIRAFYDSILEQYIWPDQMKSELSFSLAVLKCSRLHETEHSFYGGVIVWNNSGALFLSQNQVIVPLSRDVAAVYYDYAENEKDPKSVEIELLKSKLNSDSNSNLTFFDQFSLSVVDVSNQQSAPDKLNSIYQSLCARVSQSESQRLNGEQDA